LLVLNSCGKKKKKKKKNSNALWHVQW